MMIEYVKSLVENQYSPTKNFSSEILEQIDYKIHDYYQEFMASHPYLPAREMVENLAYNVYVKHHYHSFNLRRELLDEFMSTNLAKLYVIMIEEGRELQWTGRFMTGSNPSLR